MVAALRPPVSLQPRCVDLAIIGAGVGGCALAASLRREGFGGTIRLLEIGRGPGGRSATRRSRQDPDLLINHGAPCFNLRSSPSPQLIAPLAAAGWIRPFEGAIRSLDGNGAIVDPIDDGFSEGAIWQGHGSMDALCEGLLAIARGGETTAGEAWCELQGGTLVRQLKLRGEGSALRWSLRDGSGELLCEARWLVLSGSLLAHPRAQSVFGWPEVPLQVVAEERGDPQLLAAQRHLAGMSARASANLLLSLPAEAAQPWLAQPWRLLQCQEPAQQRWGLRRISIQPLACDRAAVVAESSAAFAERHLQVYGSRSSAAQLLGAKPPAEAEAAVLGALEQALSEALAAGLNLSTRDSDGQLMRWGAAFPDPPGLPESLRLCPQSALGFCGDALAGEGFGRIEGALRSAEALATQLKSVL